MAAVVFQEASVTRAWHWGIAILGGPRDSDLPASPGAPVAVSDSMLTVVVAHAQDIGPGDLDPAEATIDIAVVNRLPDTPDGHMVLHEGTLGLTDAELSLGDADDDLVLVVEPGEYLVRVSAPHGADLQRLQHVTITMARR